MKKLSFLILTIVIVLLCSSVVYATAGDNRDDGDESTEVELFTTEYPEDLTHAPDLVSDCAIIMDANTGQILYEKNAYEARYPASITKVLTMLVALENSDLDETVTFSEDAIWNIDRDSSHIALDVGEQISVEDCLYAIAIASANEAAYGLAEHVGGDLEGFADLMNQKATDLGCKNSHFVNANGLQDENHYTCAYDMALITREALNLKMFRTLTSAKSYTIPATNLQDARPLYSKNKILKSSSEYYYEYAEGSKTGYTTDSLNTLVTYAKKDDLELICVVLKCKGAKNAYTDTRALFTYCYNNYQLSYPLSDFTFESLDDTSNNYITTNYNNTITHDTLSYAIDNSFSVLIPSNADVTKLVKNVEFYDTPDKKGNAGKITISYNEQVLGETFITYTSTDETSNPYTTEEKTDKTSISLKTILIIGGIVIGVIFIILVILKIYLTNVRRRKRRGSKRNDYYF